MVCSAAETMLLCGALTTITPRVVAASTSTLSRPMPARPTTSRLGAGGEHLVGHLRGRADDQGVGAGDGVEQLAGRQPGAHVDLVAGGAEAIEPAVGDLFGDQDARHRTTCLPSSLRRLQRVGPEMQPRPLPTRVLPATGVPDVGNPALPHSGGGKHSGGWEAGTVAGRGGGGCARGDRAVVRRARPAALRRAPRHGDGDLGPGPPAARRRPTSCSGSTPSTSPAGALITNLVVAGFVVVGAVVTWLVANRLRRPRLVRAAPPHRRRRAGRVHARPGRPVPRSSGSGVTPCRRW